MVKGGVLEAFNRVSRLARISISPVFILETIGGIHHWNGYKNWIPGGTLGKNAQTLELFVPFHGIKNGAEAAQKIIAKNKNGEVVTALEDYKTGQEPNLH